MTTEKSLPFLEHLAELRRRLIIVAVTIIIAMGITWNFSLDLLRFIEKPLGGQTYLTALKRDIYETVKIKYPDIYSRYDLQKELASGTRARVLNYTAPLEPFFVQCKISLISGFILALPVIFLQIWRFVAPALKRRERRLVIPFVLSSTLAFCIGAAFFLWIVWPVIINFSLSYESEGLQSWFSLSAYVNFCIRLILIFGLIFELPVVTTLLARFSILNASHLARNRKYALLVSAIISAFHADLITMFVVMVPLYLLYEISIWVAYLFENVKPAEPNPESSG
jgi:sec-independent protein translocase protein TatC